LSNTQFDDIVNAVVTAALAEPMPMAAYVFPDWPDDDPRWRVMQIEPGWWQIDFPDVVAAAAKDRLRVMYVERLRSLGLRRPQLASALGVSLRELEKEYGL
jgi:hypothetical protein